MGLHQNVALVLVALMALGTIQPPEVDAQLCFYYVSSIRSSSVAVRTYYWYYRYYSYRCGWWGWRRCYGSYRVYVYYYYYYTSYSVYYIQKHYCCWGYYGANCDPYCPNWCGHCSGCISPYYCSCNSGWTGSSCCSDYNECLYGNGGCEQNCHNTVGSYYCSCNSGYTKSSSHCVDINECLNNNGGCSHTCHNTNGGYYCQCPTGYTLSGGKTCYDINECNTGNGGCEQTCVNTQGSYYCKCDSGYDLSSNKHNCDDHNECTNGVANCNHHCQNTMGGYYCHCDTGYELDIDDETCVDTMECNNNNGGCEQTCTNTIGSYYCTCDQGYSLHSDNHACVDINECNNNNAGCDHFCFNNIGSYTCDCKVGYSLHEDDHSCHDINECNTGNGGCDHTCVNEVGTYHCECDIGFLLDEDDHGCSDHDECATNVHDCDTLAPATCHNSHGSFYCTCPIGFRLNQDNRTCDDINECDENSSGCSQICNNVYGSYFCTCHDGFSLDADQHGCTDINECDNDAPCQSICHNLIGSYYCACNTGYQLASDQHTCVGIPCDPQLEAPDNGGIVCTGDQVTGESCTLSCRPGFELMGSATRTCQINSVWTGVETYCQHLHCPKLQDPKNGYVATVGCTSYFESTCEVKCVDGYYINGPSPHIEECRVNENDELYWSPQYTCEYIPPCQSEPCQHGGVCNEVTMTSYYCDCGDALYTGLNCETGVITIGSIPIMNTGDKITIPVAGTPDSSVTISVAVSSPNVNISQSSFTFDSNNPSSSFDISVSTPGVYSIQYELSGEDADNYETPPTSILIVIDPDVQHVDNDYYKKTGNDVGILSDGCCSPGTQYQCPGGVVNTVSFSSTCAWDNLGTTEFSTTGVVFANGNSLQIPISLTGAHMMLSEDSYGGFALPDLSEECRICDNTDPNCHYFDFTPNDYLDLLRTRALETTYLKAIDGLLPDWMSIMVDELDLTGQVAFGVDDFTSYLTTGENIYEIPGCESLDLEPDSLFAVLSQDKNITVDIDGVSMKYTPTEGDDPVCLAVNLCMSTDSPVHITVPTKAMDFVTSYDAIQAYINSGWSITFKEFLLSDNGITFDGNDGHTSLSEMYWVGSDQWVNSADIVPNFEYRANADISRLFWAEGDNLCVNMAFSGDLYHQTSPSDNDVEGILSGDLTLSWNMTVEGKSGYMSLFTTSTAALYTMPEQSSSSSAVPSGIAMSSTYVKHNMDEAFKNIIPLPQDQDNCPVDAFIALTPEKDIDYIRLRTSCLDAKVGGYLYTGNFVHDIYIAGKSFPTTPSAVPEDTVFAVFSYLGDDEIQLNEFYSIQQPTSGEAAIVCAFGRDAGSKSVTVTQAHLSILGTTFTTSLIVNDDGIQFSSGAALSLYGSFQTTVSGTIPLGTSWEDFVIELDGTFSNAQGSFLSDVQSYIYDFADSLLEDSQQRLKASELAAADAEYAEAQATQILNEKQSELNDLHAMKMKADELFTAATQTYNDAMSAYNTALESASDEALQAISLMRNVCMAEDVQWGSESIPSTNCKVIPMEEEIVEWGLKKKTYSEDRLVHSVRDVTKEKWGIELNCQLTTLIRGWGRTATGQRCSYIHTYDNITEQMLDAYYDSVEVSKTDAAVTETGSFSYSEKYYVMTPVADTIPEAACQYSDAVCAIARQPIIESVQNIEDPVIQAFLDLEMAKRHLTGADVGKKTATIAYNIAVDEYTALSTCLLYSDPNLQSNIQKIVQEEAALQTLQAVLQNTGIEQIFSIVSIDFSSGIDASTTTLPVDITYNINGNLRTLSTSIELTATTELINRALADALLVDIGTFLQSSQRKRQAVENSFNEDQFQTRCGQLNGIELYLEMIYDSLQATYDTYMEAKTNITNSITAIDSLLSTIPGEYPSIDFEYLKDNYNFEVDGDVLNTQLSTAVPVVNRTAGLMAIKDALMERMSGLQNYYYRYWQNNLKKIHSMGHIDTVGHIRCYGVVDCLNQVHEVMKGLVEDMPDSTTKQGLLSALPSARQSLIELSLYNSSLTLETAMATNSTGMNLIVSRVMSEDYWCTGIPTITMHPQSEVSFQVDDTITVECSADSVLPVTYSFERNGFLVATGLSTGVYTKRATQYDSGLYQCMATNAVGTVQSKLSNVIVYVSPVITLSPSRYETFEGDENGGFFACNATSYPEPMYEWEYSPDGSSWTTVKDSKRNELIVNKPVEEDQGWYRCKVHTAGSGTVRSEAAYLSIVSATFSQLSYRVSFLMNATEYDPDSSGNMEDQPTPPTETVTLNYFRDQLNLTYTTVDDLHVDFNTDNTVIVVHVTMSVYMNYSVSMPFDEQAAMAYAKKQDLMNGVNALQAHVKDGTFWFESEGSFFKAAHISANLNDPMYSCPSNYVLAYSNFMCVTCSPGTYYNMVDGNGVCSSCPMTTYTVEDGQTECTPCPERTDTLTTGSTWKSDCIDYCNTGYYSKTGLEECERCPNNTYTLEYRSTECINCTIEDIGIIPDCKGIASDSVQDDTSSTTFIIPIVAGGLVALLVIVVIVVVVIVVANKRQKQSQAGGGIFGRTTLSVANNPLYDAPPQDVLSLVPESEKKDYQMEEEQKKHLDNDDDAEDTDRNVVNPLYSHLEDKIDDENPYDTMEDVKAQMGYD